MATENTTTEYIKITYEEALNLLEETDTNKTIWIKDFSDEVDYYGLDDDEELKLMKEETLEEDWAEYTFYK